EGKDAFHRVARRVRDRERRALGTLLPGLPLQGVAELEKEELLQDEAPVRRAPRRVEEGEVVVLRGAMDSAEGLRAGDDLEPLTHIRGKRIRQVVEHRLRQAKQDPAQ